MKSPLPPSSYTAEQFAEQERRAFKQSWVCVGLSSQLDQHNDFVVRRIAGRSVVIQNMKGKIRAFDNVCSHRFSRIQTAASGNRPLQCPYHGWAYNADGIPIGIPSRPRFDECSVDWCESLRLRSWDVASLGSFVFVRGDLCTSTLPDWLGNLGPTLIGLSEGIGDCFSTTTMPIKANWKVAVENTLESYHVDAIHPDSFSRLKPADGEFAFFGPHSTWATTLDPGLTKKLANPLRALASRGCHLPGYLHIHLFPHVTVASSFGTTFSLQVFEPLNPGATHFTTHVFRPALKSPSASASTISDTLCESARVFNEQVFHEDKEICEEVQRGCESLAAMPREHTNWGQLSDEEQRVGHFQSAYLDWVNHDTESVQNRRFVLVGAGDLGREIASWILEPSYQAANLSPAVAFLDDALTGSIPIGKHPVPILGAVNTYSAEPCDVFLVCVMDPTARRRLIADLTAQRVRFGRFIAPTAVVSQSAQVASGAIICPHSTVSHNATVSPHVVINIGSSVGHDAFVGEGCVISSHVDITGHVQIGEFTFIGSHAVILPNVRVGAFARIGANATIMHHIKDRHTYAAQAAKRVQLTAEDS